MSKLKRPGIVMSKKSRQEISEELTKERAKIKEKYPEVEKPSTVRRATVPYPKQVKESIGIKTSSKVEQDEQDEQELKGTSKDAPKDAPKDESKDATKNEPNDESKEQSDNASSEQESSEGSTDVKESEEEEEFRELSKEEKMNAELEALDGRDVTDKELKDAIDRVNKQFKSRISFVKTNKDYLIKGRLGDKRFSSAEGAVRFLIKVYYGVEKYR